jgi:phosphate-selective porin OprO and OprP
MSNARTSQPLPLRLRLRAAIVIAAAVGVLVCEDAAATSQAELEQLVRDQARRLDEQDARVRELERQLAALAPPPPAAHENNVSLQGTPGRAPAVTATDHAFAIGDSANQLRFHAVLNVDGRYFGEQNPPPGADTWLLRQARPILEGTLSQVYDFRLTPDFGGGKTVIQDAFLTGRFSSEFQITAGKFKTPFGLERLQYDTDIRFIERGLPNNLVPNRDLGIQIAGESLGRRLNYAFAAQNGVSDGGSSDAIGDVDSNNGQEFTARLFARPFRFASGSFWQGLGVGIAGSYSSSAGAAGRALTPSYYSPGQRLIFVYRAGTTPTVQSGGRVRFSPQLYFYRGSFGLLGEFVQVDESVARTVGTDTRTATVRQRAWQLSAGYYVTGERSGYEAVAPSAALGSGSGFGAIELVVRAGVLDIDPDVFTGGPASFADPAISVRRATAVAAGANWYLTPAVKTVLDYEVTTFRGGAPLGDRPIEKALFGRFQMGF